MSTKSKRKKKQREKVAHSKTGSDQKVVDGAILTPDGLIGRSVTLRSRVIKGKTAESKLGKREGEKAMGDVLIPTFDPRLLMQVVSESSILPACIACMQVNVDGFGYTLDTVAKRDTVPSRIKKERAAIKAFFDNINFDHSLTYLRMQARRDLEAVGFAGWEFIRDGKMEIVEVNFIPAKYLRMTKKDKEYTTFKQSVIMAGKVTKVTRKKRFRRYVWRSGSSIDVYYREFGDPRALNCETGEYEKLSVDDPKYATEVYMFSLIDDGDIYPVPRWISTLIDALGCRKAGELNFNYFRNNMFIPFVVLVSGGILTEESVRRLEETMAQSKGDDTPFQALILEAFGKDLGQELLMEGRSSGLHLEIKPLIETVKDDMLFRLYDVAGRNKQRVAFRIPKILLGESEDYNRASAEAALSVVNSQVFDVERHEFDDFINRLIFPLKGFVLHKFRSLAYKASDPEVVASVIEKLSRAGVLCPATARLPAAEILGMDLEIPDAEYTKIPFPLTVALVQMGILGKDDVTGDLTVPEDFRGKALEKGGKSKLDIILDLLMVKFMEKFAGFANSQSSEEQKPVEEEEGA